MIGWGCNTKEHGDTGQGLTLSGPLQRNESVMAKAISVMEALSVLADAGIELGEDHAEAIKSLTEQAYKSRAVAIIGGDADKYPGKLNENNSESDAEAWVTRLFDMAEDFANDFVGETKNVQGGAVRTVRVVGIDSPAGHFKVELRSE